MREDGEVFARVKMARQLVRRLKMVSVRSVMMAGASLKVVMMLARVKMVRMLARVCVCVCLLSPVYVCVSNCAFFLPCMPLSLCVYASVSVVCLSICMYVLEAPVAASPSRYQALSHSSTTSKCVYIISGCVSLCVLCVSVCVCLSLSMCVSLAVCLCVSLTICVSLWLCLYVSL